MHASAGREGTIRDDSALSRTGKREGKQSGVGVQAGTHAAQQQAEGTVDKWPHANSTRCGQMNGVGKESRIMSVVEMMESRDGDSSEASNQVTLRKGAAQRAEEPQSARMGGARSAMNTGAATESSVTSNMKE